MELVYLIYLGPIVIALLLSLIFTYVRYRRLKIFLPKLIEEKGLNPEHTYLVSGNSSSFLEVVSFEKSGLRQILITNYWVRGLSLLDKDLVIKYGDIDYAIQLPTLEFSLILKNDLKTVLKKPIESSLNIALAKTYLISKHGYMNYAWLKGSTETAVKSELLRHNVEVRLSSKDYHRRRNNWIVIATLSLAVIVVAISINLLAN